MHTGHDDVTLAALQNELNMIKIGKDSKKLPSWLHAKKPMVPDFIAKDPKVTNVFFIFLILPLLTSSLSFSFGNFYRTFVLINFFISIIQIETANMGNNRCRIYKSRSTYRRRYQYPISACNAYSS